MINFPIFDRLDISGYGLYPGTEDTEAGLHIDFQPGLTLVLGTNGLGKTTLVNIIYKLLTGPYKISGLTGRSELGSSNLDPTLLSSYERSSFAQRVVDGARDASARLSFLLGSNNIVIERRLSDLSLTYFSIDGKDYPIQEKDNFHVEIPHHAGIGTFGDWILLLNYLVFYFEDRRALVWDSTAQWQVLRRLFLPVATESQLDKDERAILELDSHMRNMNAVLSKEERIYLSSKIKEVSGADVHEQLLTLEELRKIDYEKRERLESQTLEIEDTRERARLRLLKAEQEQESRYRNLERAKLIAIGTSFPNQSETARYIFAQLLTEQDCLVCGTHVPVVAADYADRVEQQQCIVCGTDLSTSNTQVENKEDIDKAIKSATVEFHQIEIEASEARTEQDSAERRYQTHITAIRELNIAINDRSRNIDILISRLPPDESEMYEQKSALDSRRTRVELLKVELAEMRQDYRKLVDEVTRNLVGWSDRVNSSFNEYAKGFLLEACQLIWSPKSRPIGQGGEKIDFPSFELEMTGTDFTSPVRRSGPEQVSESQREFIDLAFRMALINVAGNDARASLVIDAPESSLDAVFEKRAAAVLSRFANPQRDNRLLITSNLVAGQLIPSLIAESTSPNDISTRVINLIEIAAPTQAVSKLKDEYTKVLNQLLGIIDVEEHP